MILVLTAHALVAAACVAGGARLGRRTLLVGAAGPLAAVAFWVWWSWRGGTVVEENVTWLPELGLDLGFRMDGFSALMVALVGGIGVLIFLYAWSYFSERPGLGRFTAYLVVFAGAMFGLVTADNVLLLFVFWELTSVSSYLLIGFEDESASARASALQALLVTGAGGLAMLAGLVLLAQAGGTYSLAELLATPPSGGVVGPALMLVLVGALAKSAQFPFHFWLPGAMAAPTPVSAYLHSATMVKAGIYVVARLAPVYAVLVPWWRPTLVTVGAVTMLVGGWRALAQSDIKLLLAQGTVSQLGFIVVLVGSGSPELTFAGTAMILAHAAFKAPLFMVAGIVDHQAHTRDLRRLSSLYHRMPATAVTAAAAVASMIGLAPLLGFVTKEAALAALVAESGWWVTAVVVLGSALTVAYGLRLVWETFAAKSPATSRPDLVGTEVYAPGWWFLAPAAVLAALSVAGGLAPVLAESVVGPAAEALDAATAGFHLALWHGFGIPLALSAAALVAGGALWRRPLPALRRFTAKAPEATRVYAAAIAGLNRTADRVTSVVQSGSLPVYLLVILSVAVAAPGVVMVRNWSGLPPLAIAVSPLQVVVAVVVVGAAFGAVTAPRRFGAVLFLGAVGYGVAALFVIQGAADLALTQLLIETLALALFVVVLSRFPIRFETVQTNLRRISRLTVSVGVGVTASCLALWAAAGRVADSPADEFMAQALPGGGGRNVVNVILTDFRGLDTLGEITVLAVAAMGVLALVRAPRPDDDGIGEGER